MNAPKRKTHHEYESNVYPPITDREINDMIQNYVDEYIENKHLVDIPVCIDGLCEPVDE